MARKATRSIALSPVVRSVNRRKFDIQKFMRVWLQCHRQQLGIKDVAHLLKWHLDDVVRVAREAREMLSLVGEDLPMLRSWA